MAEEQRRGGIGEGIRTGIGILSALREAVEETLQEAVDRGDVSPDRARRAIRDMTERLSSTLEEARDRVDVVSRRELDELREEVAALRERVARLEGPPPAAGEQLSPGGIIVPD